MAERQNKQEVSWQMKLLLLVPKNLVYVFVCIILFAFGGMLYITYTEKNMTEFLTYDRTQEVVVVDPLFQKLQKTLILDQYTVTIEPDASKLDHQRFNKFYLIRNRPVLVKGLASDWKATQKWSNFTYLKEHAGTTTSLVSVLAASNVPEGSKPDWSQQRVRPHKVPLTLEKSLSRIEDNVHTSVATVKNGTLVQPVVHFIDYDMLRAPQLRADYNFPLLHKFLRLHDTTLSVWPPVDHRPKQAQGEVFMCVIEGAEEFRLVSSVFKQNLYSGVYDDIAPTEIPEDINLFKVDTSKYPLLGGITDYILKTRVEKGDCLYIPAYYWF